VHIVKAKGIGRLLADWVRFASGVAFIPGMPLKLRFIITE
jgi:hypothetical protein